MKLLRVGIALLMAAGVAACSKDTSGTLVTQDPLAGLRYVNLVPDTGAVDFRVIDVVENAPDQVAATFRTGGSPSGVATTFLPPHAPVLAGTRHIRVFMNGTTAAVASQVVLDTTFTFDQGFNYTFYMYGYTRTGQAPAVRAFITKDSLPSATAAQWQVRVIHLAPTLAPTFAATPVDVWVDSLAAAATPVGAPTFANVNLLQTSAYLPFTARGSPALNYRVAIAATGTTTPIVSAAVPAGVVGTSSTNPIAGDLVGGTGISAVIVPPSVVGSQAPQAAAFLVPTILFLIDKQPPVTAP